MPNVIFQDWGMVDYKEAWDRQELYFAKTLKIKSDNRTNNTQIPTDHYLFFCEHPHVYTLGKSGKQENLLLDDDGLNDADATYYKINRGGDITYHGPGQIVGYPILDLDYFFTDIHKYLRFLEDAIINTLKKYGIESGRIPGLTGVWLDVDDASKARKICAMGVRCSRWVTMHGFAFNVNSNLNYFNNIIPCGIDDKAVTSMEKELGHPLDFEEVKSVLKNEIAILFEMKFISNEKELS
ncbi:MAG: lipoyl(octanoyl) transferase LipB [Sphingobacteriales bacterium]|nr:lipoyl(octanoyl) transferase LipB [Sphingobacteriales bacterium]